MQWVLRKDWVNSLFFLMCQWTVGQWGLLSGDLFALTEGGLQVPFQGGMGAGWGWSGRYGPLNSQHISLGDFPLENQPSSQAGCHTHK